MMPHSRANCSPASEASAQTSTPVARLICVLISRYLRNLAAVAIVPSRRMRPASRLRMARMRRSASSTSSSPSIT